jgi:hypothetical protein
MDFITSIISYCYQASNYFYSLYTNSVNATFPLSSLASFFYSLSLLFTSLSYAFNDFRAWLYNASDKISKILSIDTIVSYFNTWINYATNAWNWILNAANVIAYNIGAWWNTTQQTVLYWIDQAKQWALAQVNNLATTLAPVLAGWNSFVASIPSLNEILLWFTNWWANVLSHLSSWWAERLLDIKTLFDSWTLDLAPFWEGWQEIRETVFSFFNNPFDWLWDKFTNWFLGAE